MVRVRPGKSARLADLISRYGGAIERDLLRVYGLDLGTEWAALRRHRRLLNLIENLGSDSAFVEAMTNDPNVVEGIMSGRIKVAEPDAESEPGPRVSEWSPEMSLLAEIADRLGTLITIGMMANGGARQLPKIPPSPRPITAVTRAANERKAQEKRENALEIIRIFTPDDPLVQGMTRREGRDSGV